MMMATRSLILAASWLPAALATAASSGTFNALSMNVAGLPAILNSNGDGDKTTNTMMIGEDFNAYE